MRKLLAAFSAVAAVCLAPSLASAADGPVTFTKDVAPILYKSCVECHRPTMFAPMSLVSYDEARPYARSIKNRVVSRVMPPWGADAPHGVFKNDPRLSEKEIETIVAWVDGGAVKGDDKDLPRVPQFAEGWTIGKPDAVFTFMPGGMGVSLVKQYRQAGLADQIPVLSAFTVDESTLPAQQDAAIGMFGGSNWEIGRASCRERV